MARRRKAAPWPDWWSWELELTPHLEKRMEDRGFSEVELRRMLETANDHRPDALEGRWVIETLHDMRRWEVIVEPDFDEKVIVVITAFGVDD